MFHWRLRVGLGDHTAFPITYSQGHAPLSDNKIALSAQNAGDLEKVVGDELTLWVDDAEKRLTVYGVYSDVTNGGRTAQVVFEAKTGDVLQVGILATFSDRAMVDAAIARSRDSFPFAKVYGVGDNIEQMLQSPSY